MPRTWTYCASLYSNDHNSCSLKCPSCSYFVLWIVDCGMWCIIDKEGMCAPFLLCPFAPVGDDDDDVLSFVIRKPSHRSKPSLHHSIYVSIVSKHAALFVLWTRNGVCSAAHPTRNPIFKRRHMCGVEIRVVGVVCVGEGFSFQPRNTHIHTNPSSSSFSSFIVINPPTDRHLTTKIHNQTALS